MRFEGGRIVDLKAETGREVIAAEHRRRRPGAVPGRGRAGGRRLGRRAHRPHLLQHAVRRERDQPHRLRRRHRAGPAGPRGQSDRDVAGGRRQRLGDAHRLHDRRPRRRRGRAARRTARRCRSSGRTVRRPSSAARRPVEITLSGGHSSPVSGDARYMSQPAPLGTPHLEPVVLRPRRRRRFGRRHGRPRLHARGDRRRRSEPADDLAGRRDRDRCRPPSRSPAPTTTAPPGAPSAPATCSSAPAASRSRSASAGSPSTAAPPASTPTAAPCRPSGRRAARSVQLRGLVAMDVSSSGCRLSGIGEPPPDGREPPPRHLRHDLRRAAVAVGRR